MSKIDQILLDLDGPLLDGREKHYYCYRYIMEQYAFPAISIDRYWERKRDRCDRRTLLAESDAVNIYDDYLAAWLKLIETPDALALDRIQVGALDCLHKWQGQQIKVILVTMRKNKKALDEQLRKLDLLLYLNAVIVCDHAKGGIGKAQAVRDIFTDQRFGEHSIWIGDTEADWEAARSIESRIVLVANGLRNERYLRSLENALVIPTISSLIDVDLEVLNVS